MPKRFGKHKKITLDSPSRKREKNILFFPEIFFKKGLILEINRAIMCSCMNQNWGIGGVTMPNIKSSKKDVISSKIAYEKNKANKSALKTAVKKFEAAVVGGDRAAAEAAHKNAVQAVDKAVTKGILHKSTAARKKSSMTLHLNKMA